MALTALDAVMRQEMLNAIKEPDQSGSYLAQQAAKLAIQEDNETRRQAERDTLTALRNAEFTEVTPQNVSRLRARIFRTVEQRLVDADAVLAGRKVWTGHQVQIFRALLSKVMPDVHHSEVSVGVESRDLNELSRDELEALVASHRLAESKTIDAAAILEAKLNPPS